MTEPGKNGAVGEDLRSEPRSRAVRDPERFAEEWAERVGRWVLRAGARAKEEAEDIWAEAQARRREM